ncbi:glucosamine-6-phosphate deaminase [candidate division KSB1 bacterium]
MESGETGSTVERNFLDSSDFKIIYTPEEKINTIILNNFPDLGKLTALRFIEWIQNNPDGSIALPTGKTPEYFIKWIGYLLKNWNTKDVKKILEIGGVDAVKKPDLSSLRFIQIDEFYPINPSQHNSFYYYVNHFYMDGFGLDPEKALLINCYDIGLGKGDTLESVWPDNEVNLSLRYRQAKNKIERKQKEVIERIDQWCQEYEEKIRILGGIGFFLGGIGPDGHIGFNVRGSDHNSTTRLTETNYETQAAAAADLGGIETARKRHVITIGLGTITFNQECTAIITAAGEAKADIVSQAIQSEPDILYPATCLQKLKNSAFYITKGASKKLIRRQKEILINGSKLPQNKIDEIIVDTAYNTGKMILDLTVDDMFKNGLGKIIINEIKNDFEVHKKDVYKRLINKLEKGMNSLTNTRFLHAEPHHDDLMLGCLPYIVRHVRSATNTHYFMTLTSGFTSVTNTYMLHILSYLREFISTDKFKTLFEEDYFDPDSLRSRNRDVWQYLDGVAADSESVLHEGTSRRLLRNLISIYGNKELINHKVNIKELQNYFKESYPGKKDTEEIQKLKGMCREWEAECLWGYFGWECSHILHKRLGFYKGDIFNEEPLVERDVEPILETLLKTKPDVISLALDPEASGPDTHYKVLQAVTEAIKRYENATGRRDIKIIGYRNVWYRFNPIEADIIVPVSLNMFSIMYTSFLSTFLSQKDASFPSYEHDGPFSELAQKIQVEQYQKVKTCLGRSWFYDNSSPLVRATRGLVFLKEMTLEELYEHSIALRQLTENK